MVLCRFFQNGYCKYGETCRFEHSRVGGHGGGGGYGGGGSGEHYGNHGRSEGYHTTAGYSQSPTRYSNYENRADYRNNSRGGYKTDYRNDQRTDYRNDQRTDYRNDNRNNNINDNRGGYRADNRSENRFAVLTDRHESSRSNQLGGGGGGGRQYDARYSYRSDQHKKEGDNEEPTSAEILESITEDMEMWETGKMWLFSCYAYARETKSFPGLDDWSADEVRLKAYEANASGTMAAHHNWLSHLTEDCQAKRTALKKPDPNARAALLNLIEDIKRSSLQNASSKTAHTGGARLFTSETNAFGATAPVINAFGAATPTTNAFGGVTPATNAFGAVTPATNAFGAVTPATNVFGAPRPQTNVFGAPRPQTNVFGAHMPQTNAFGAHTPQTNVFGAHTPQTNAFGVAMPTNASSSSAYAGTARPGFSVNTLTPIAPTAADAFSFGASTPQNKFSPAGTSGLLPAPTANTQNSSSQPSSVKLLGLYTPVVELSAEEKAEFESAKFTLDRVPLRPPPKDLI